MTKNKIAIQGELGAYSHIAAKDLFKDTEIKTCATFEETFKQAHEDENYKIIIPIENSLAGRVADIHYLLPKYKLQIHGEYFLNVEHNLLCKPEANIKDIKYVSLKRSNLELERNLEQLRALENKMSIHVGYIDTCPLSVDTEEDLIEIRKIMKKNDKK